MLLRYERNKNSKSFKGKAEVGGLDLGWAFIFLVQTEHLGVIRVLCSSLCREAIGRNFKEEVKSHQGDKSRLVKPALLN